jgi:CheY-like chemotaxis protein
MAIAQSLIVQHGGTIAAHSDGLDRGAELVVHWPLAPARADAPPPSLSMLSGHPLRVLVVDDNVAAAELLGEIVRVLGHEPIVVHDSASALAHAEAAVPHVALVDIGLPLIDGYDLAARLRALPQLAATRLIALTGYDEESDREKSARAGFDAHVVKPIDQTALAQLLATRGPATQHGDRNAEE